ncbi:MAG: hypothetical protein ACRDO8_13170 [Nocardioidaceae bacterium]
MTAARRWCVVGLGVLLLVSAPVVVRAVPAPDSGVSANALLSAIRGSDRVAYSGYAESDGTVHLPVTNEFESTAALFGERTRLRVWWRGADDWRVSKLRTTGETGLFHDGTGTTRWVYESARATRTPIVRVRLPDVSDLVPPVLARHLLTGTRRSEVTRLPAERIAGRDAPGLRLVPSDPRSTIAHVDVWADPSTGVPVRVLVYGDGEDAPVMSTAFDQLTTEVPAAATTRFEPPPGTDLRFDDTVDLAAAADRFAPVSPPVRLAGLDRRGDLAGAAGVYGRGPTVLLAVPLWGRVADRLDEQLAAAPGAEAMPYGTRLAAGPLRLLLARPGLHDRSWLLIGTVTARTLHTAASQLTDRGFDRGFDRGDDRR